MEVNEYELLYMIHQNDEAALRMLMQKHDESVRYIIFRYKKYQYRSWQIDDALQLAAIKLIDAVYTFQEDREASFQSYYLEIFRRALIDQMRRNFASKISYDNGGISLDRGISEASAKYQGVYVVSQDDMKAMYVNSRIHEAKRDLTSTEKAIIDLRAQGNTYMQIANQLHVTKKKVEYTLKKVRNNKRKKR